MVSGCTRPARLGAQVLRRPGVSVVAERACRPDASNGGGSLEVHTAPWCSSTAFPAAAACCVAACSSEKPGPRRARHFRTPPQGPPHAVQGVGLLRAGERNSLLLLVAAASETRVGLGAAHPHTRSPNLRCRWRSATLSPQSGGSAAGRCCSGACSSTPRQHAWSRCALERASSAATTRDHPPPPRRHHERTPRAFRERRRGA